MDEIMTHKINISVEMRYLTSIFILTFLFCEPVLARFADGSRYAFITSPVDRSISVIDLQQQNLAGTIQMDKPISMAVASEKLIALIVSHPPSMELTLVDLNSPGLDRYDYPLALTPDYIKLSPLTDTIAIYDRARRIVEIHAIKRRELLVRIENVNSTEPFTFNSDGSRFYWINNDTGHLHVADLWSETGSVRLSGPQSSLSAVSRSINGALGFVSDAQTGKVYVIDLKTLSVLRSVPVGNRPGRPWGTSDGISMLVPNRADGTISVISTETYKVSDTIQAIDNPIAVNTGWLDSTATVVNQQGEIGLINLLNGTLEQKSRIPGSPQEAVVTSDSRIIAIPFSGHSGTVALFDMKTRSLKQKIEGLPGDLGTATLAVSNNLCH